MAAEPPTVAIYMLCKRYKMRARRRAKLCFSESRPNSPRSPRQSDSSALVTSMGSAPSSPRELSEDFQTRTTKEILSDERLDAFFVEDSEDELDKGFLSKLFRDWKKAAPSYAVSAEMRFDKIWKTRLGIERKILWARRELLTAEGIMLELKIDVRAKAARTGNSPPPL